jgi:hypothetical protein
VDTLITVGIASSRADVLRWAVARDPGEPGLPQLRNLVEEIDRLKTKF